MLCSALPCLFWNWKAYRSFFSAANQNVSFLHRNSQHRITPTLPWISAWGKSFPGVIAISCLLTELQGSSKDAELITPSLIFSWCKTAAPVISTERHHSAQNEHPVCSASENERQNRRFCQTRKDNLTHTIAYLHHLQQEILLFSPTVAMHLPHHIHASSSVAPAAVK